MERRLPYDDADPESIEEYAQKLIGRTLREAVAESGEDLKRRLGKGGFGQTVEEAYFHYSPNPTAGPDFPNAGVELKTTPAKETSKGLRSKERLVLSLIDYESLAQESEFEKSAFWEKNQLLLLLVYLWEREKDPWDYVFKIARLWRFPERDLRIIRRDWEKIVTKVKAGQAHLLSGKDTFYLEAATKGANRKSLRKQRYSDELAMQRAFALKSRYINTIIDTSLAEQLGSITLEDETEDFESLVIARFARFYGRTETELKSELGLYYSQRSKHRYFLLAKAMLGVSAEGIEEFEKSGVKLKTIRLEENGKIRESMSFRQIKFREIVEQEWEESDFFEELDRPFLFIIFQKDKGDLIFREAMFWSIPDDDLIEVRRVWEDSRDKIRRGEYREFISASDKRVAHVRPKARDGRDLMETPQGTFEKKKCFWLNRDYVLSQIQQ